MRLRTAGERCRGWNARMDFFRNSVTEENRKQRVCERRGRGKDRICAQFGETEKKSRGGAQKTCVCVVVLVVGVVGQTARNNGYRGHQVSAEIKKEGEETRKQPRDGGESVWEQGCWWLPQPSAVCVCRNKYGFGLATVGTKKRGGNVIKAAAREREKGRGVEEGRTQMGLRDRSGEGGWVEGSDSRGPERRNQGRRSHKQIPTF